MKTIKIKYTDFWQGFNPDNWLLHRVLKERFDVVLSDNPDYIIYSNYSVDFLNYDCVRIFYSGENLAPDFNLCDYAIGFDDINFGDRYFQLPNYIMNFKYEKSLALMQNKHKTVSPDSAVRKFCSMVVSNGNRDKVCDSMFEKLSEYKQVDSGGRYRNNIGLPNGVSDKIEFQSKYKFSLALENSSQKDYITEKIVEAFASGTVPIYWGGGGYCDVYNEKAFVNLNSFATLEEAVNEIIRIDQDAERYKAMLSAPALKDPLYIENKKNGFEKFVVDLFSQPVENAKRRPDGVWGNYMGDVYRRGWPSVAKPQPLWKRMLQRFLRTIK